MKGAVIKVFPGGNTSEGFFSYYRYLLEKGTKKIFIFKGGPGVGKSTLMKKIGYTMVDLGHDVEFHYCSSDSNSLDGIALLKYGIVLVDGTAPHIIDPKYPGGVDEIINLGEFWDAEGIQAHREKIIASTNEVSRFFARSYKYLAAARNIAENISAIHAQSMNHSAVFSIGAELENSLLEFASLSGDSSAPGLSRHLFSSAYSPQGYIDFTDSILQRARRIYYLEGVRGSGKSDLMKRIAARAIDKGMDVEIYHTPLIPQEIGSILIKDINVGLTSSPLFREKNYKTINLNEYLDKGFLANFEEEIRSDSELLDRLTEQALINISRAKQEHDVLEEYYKSNMDYAAIEDKYEELLSRILYLTGNEVSAVAALRYN